MLGIWPISDHIFLKQRETRTRPCVIVSVLPAGLTVEWEDWFRKNPESIELVTQGTLPGNVLSRVGPIETVDAVDAKYSSLISSYVVVAVSVAPRLFETGESGREKGDGGEEWQKRGERKDKGKE